MALKCSAWLMAITLVLLTFSAPQTARGEDLIVEHNPPKDSGHFITIQAAIDHATELLKTNPASSFIIKVKADPIPYSLPFTPINRVPIQGESETAGTLISGSSSSPIVTLSGVDGVTIKNLTFLNAVNGILVSNSTSVTITNNVFHDITGTAVQVVNSPTASIINNTFFTNGTAVSTASDILITNNIFSINQTAISAQIALNSVSYNDYHLPNTVTADPNSIPNAIVLNPDPLFVDPANHDFHLQVDSPCHSYAGLIGGSTINAGNPNYPNAVNSGSFDMGAYGGPNSDRVPMVVTGLASSTVTPGVIGLSWDPNLSYQVSGYNVHYGSAVGVDGTGASEGPSPIFIAQGTNSATLSNFAGATTAPTVPVITGISPKNQALALTWSPSSADATGYKVFYSPFPTPVDLSSPSVAVAGGSTTSFVLSGLQNGVTYNVAVQAVNQNQLFITVTAVNNHPATSNPGIDNESAFSQALSQTIGQSQESALSLPATETPEAVVPFPNLKGEGCFIATAAYGCYSAPQVQALRDFRDRYLLTNAPGRAFVAWYYRYGPVGAHFINVHPWLKAPVRVALFPLVVGALILNATSPLANAALALLAALLPAFFFRRQLLAHFRRHALNKTLLTLVLIVIPALALGAEPRPDRPHWSLELKGGAFFPDAADWSKFYGSRFTGEYGGALGYQVLRQLEVGIEGSYLRATGQGQLPNHAVDGSPTLAGDVRFELFPLDVFVLARGIFSEDQLLVPYVAAGYTRLFYRQEVEGQGTTRGSVNGYHARGGIQLLLDGVEPDASRSLYFDYGVHHSYLFLEAKYLRALADTVAGGSVNIGGSSCLAGFLFEF